jgi:hypothetical protein
MVTHSPSASEIRKGTALRAALAPSRTANVEGLGIRDEEFRDARRDL